MRKPARPRKPTKPTKPTRKSFETYEFKAFLKPASRKPFNRYYERVIDKSKLKALLAKQEETPRSEIVVRTSSYSPVLGLMQPSNPKATDIKYRAAMETYDSRMKDYEEKLIVWEEKMLDYDIKMKKYEEEEKAKKVFKLRKELEALGAL